RAGGARPADVLAADRSLLRGRGRRAAPSFPAGTLHALRAGSLRDGLSCQRHGAQPRRPEPAGLQSLHRHAHLLGLLSLQGAALQLVRIHRRRPRFDPRHAQPRRHGAQPRRHGEVHLLHPAHLRRAYCRQDRWSADPRRRGRHRLPAGLSDTGHRVRRHYRSQQRGQQAQGQPAQLQPARGGQHAAAHHLSRAGPQMSDIAPSARDFGTVTREVVDISLHYPDRRAWWMCFIPALLLLLSFVVSVTVLFWYGVGVWGNNIPMGWALAISNYIFFLGIGHAGTLISALLLLLAQHWRNSLNRFAEAMTLFAVVCGSLYPLVHLGRPWLFYWMAPYPNTMTVWPQFKSPLTWDFFAVLTYLIVSILFWYIGIVPDLASARDRATRRRYQVFFGLFALGWRGSARHWARWRQSYRLTAAIAVPLVVSVHSEISMLLAAGPINGWNSTVFPPYFVAGAAFSGFAVVSMIAVVLRHALGLRNLVTARHLDLLAKLPLLCGMMTAYGYWAETFDTLYGNDPQELETMRDRLVGVYAWSYWGAVFFNFVPLQLLWWYRVRTNPVLLFLISLSCVIGMWMERYMLLVTTLYRDWLVSSWQRYHPSIWDWSLF